MKNLSLEDLIFLSQESDNIIMTNWLKELEQMIQDNPNNYDLGEKVRQIK